MIKILICWISSVVIFCSVLVEGYDFDDEFNGTELNLKKWLVENKRDVSIVVSGGEVKFVIKRTAKKPGAVRIRSRRPFQFAELTIENVSVSDVRTYMGFGEDIGEGVILFRNDLGPDGWYLQIGADGKVRKYVLGKIFDGGKVFIRWLPNKVMVSVSGKEFEFKDIDCIPKSWLPVVIGCYGNAKDANLRFGIVGVRFAEVEWEEKEVSYFSIPRSREERIRWFMGSPPKTFHLGVYITDSSGKGTIFDSDGMLRKAFREFAERSIDVVKINQAGFCRLLPRGLLKLAHNYGIFIVVQNFMHSKMLWTGRFNENQLRKQTLTLKSLIDNDPYGYMVIGYGLQDEIESNFPPSKSPKANEMFRRFVNLVHQIDPNRITVINHTPRNADGGNLFWYCSGEDVPWCSVFVILGSNSWFVDKIKGLADKCGWKNFIAVSQACGGVNNFKNADLRWYGFPEDVSAKDYRDYPITEQVKETIVNGYRLGLSGVVFFIYNSWGGYYLPWSFVDGKGDDIGGKWSAFLDGAREVRRVQGWPEIESVKFDSDRLIVKTTGRYGGHRVRMIVVDESNDGGMNWKRLGKIMGGKGAIDLGGDNDDSGKSALLRVRAWDGCNWSMWKFVEKK